MLFFKQKNVRLLCCLSLAVYRSLSPFSLLSFAGLPPTFPFSLSFSCSISKFVDMTINLRLILQTKRIQKQFPLSVFVFIDSLVVSALQDSGGYAISRQNNLELHLGCHGIPVVRTDGRRLSVYGHVITKFSTYPWCSAGKRFARERAPLQFPTRYFPRQESIDNRDELYFI